MCLLLLFSFSITPKKTLHSVFGCHKETGKRIGDDRTEQLNTKIFHCSCDQQDLQSPFLQTPPFLSAAAFIYGDPFITGYTTAFYGQTIPSPDLRGPPSVI
jgi:hypothetical protein